ncbi:MAG: hypothetical protein K2N12_09705 [Helicobacter sp.]|nr:hypothetical protein [Helicobacter sp.]
MSIAPLAFIFRALSPVGYFEKLIVEIAQEHVSCFGTQFDENHGRFILKVSGSKEELTSLSDALSTLPVSLFFCFEKVELLDEKEAIEPRLDSDFPPFLFESQRPLQSFALSQTLDEQTRFPYNGHLFLDGVDVLGDDDAKEGVIALSFRALAQKLIEGEELYFQTLYGAKILSLRPQNREWIVPLDLASLELLFRASKAQASALASWEKPILFLPPKQLLADDLESTHTQKLSLHAPIVIAFGEAVVLPYDNALQILALCLKEQGIDALYLRSCTFNEAEAREQYPNAFIAPLITTAPLLLTMTDNSTFFVLSKERSMLAYPSYVRLLADNGDTLPRDCVCVHLSYDLPTVGAILQQGRLKKVLNIAFPLRVGMWLQDIMRDETGAKLLQNFKKAYPQTENLLFDESMHKIHLASAHQSNNIFDILGIIYQLFYDETADLASAKARMLAFAEGFLGQNGPRIDFKLAASENGVQLTHLSILRSAMSFRLAGVDEQTLAFGILESLAEFFSNFIRDLCENFALNAAVVSGSMLSFTPLANRLLHFMPSNIALVLPTNNALDCIRYS